MEKFKDVVIENVEYRLGVLTPKIGSMIMLQMKNMLTNEDIYGSVLTNCLGVVSVLEEKNGQKFPLKLYSKAEEKWLQPEIQNPKVLMELLMSVVDFNLEPFIAPSQEQGDTSNPQTTLQFSSPMA